ncbi:MAG: HisA/HisF-related TIM barrel protein, partial [Sphaerochaetaceae bacterium]
VSKDGMLSGPSFELYEDLIKLKKKFPSFYLIASGGVECIEDLERLKKLKVDGCIVGKAIYENRISLSALKEMLC